MRAGRFMAQGRRFKGRKVEFYTSIYIFEIKNYTPDPSTLFLQTLYENRKHWIFLSIEIFLLIYIDKIFYVCMYVHIHIIFKCNEKIKNN